MTGRDYSAPGKDPGGGIRLGFIATLFLAVVLGVIFIGGFWVGSFMVSDRIAFGVSYRGLDLSGLSGSDAENIIQRDSRQPMAKNALVLVYGKDFSRLPPGISICGWIRRRWWKRRCWSDGRAISSSMRWRL